MIKNINVFRKSVWIASIELAALVLIISLAFYSLLPVATHPQAKKEIFIAKGTTVKGIISQLHESGYDVGFIDQLILRKMPYLKEGVVTFKTDLLNRIDFLYALTKGKIPPKKVDLFKITLIPGETKEIFFDLIAKTLELNQTKLSQAYDMYAKYPEAAIAADTYLAPKHMDEEKLMQFLLKNSEKNYKKLATQYYDDYNQTQWNKILIIASIIQKEAANNEEMPVVASVIYNRLKKNMRLQMDGTLNYGKYSHIKVTPQRIKTDMTTFNTYKHRGLPSSPIGAVGKDAIKAAISPAKTSYLFFMKNKKGLHDFTTSFKKHRKNIKNAR